MNNFRSNSSVYDSQPYLFPSHMPSDSRTFSNSNDDKKSAITNNLSIKNKTKNTNIRPSSRLDIQSKLIDHLSIVRGGKDPDGFITKKEDEECIKCLLRMPHKKCESHKYIRIGGGYRHSYFYVKMLLDHIEFQRQKEEIRLSKLDMISEGNTRAFKTYIRTSSGRLIEKIIYLNEADYEALMNSSKSGLNPADILNKYLNKEEIKNFDSYDKEEQEPIITYRRTQSGRIVEKVTYMPKNQNEIFQKRKINNKEAMGKRSHLLPNGKFYGSRSITTKTDDKSGRIRNENEIGASESYRVFDEEISKELSKSHFQNPSSKTSDMKVVKTFVRTKSGRLVEKTIYLTEEEYQKFLDSNCDPNFLADHLDLKDGKIEKWQKESSDEEKYSMMGGLNKDYSKSGGGIDPLTGKLLTNITNKNKDEHGLSSEETIKNNTVSNEERMFNEKATFEAENQKKKSETSKFEDSDNSYFSETNSEGGKKQLKQKRIRDDHGNIIGYGKEIEHDGKGKSVANKDDSQHNKHSDNSDYSYFSDVSIGGTHYRKRKEKIRNKDGKIIGYKKEEDYNSDTQERKGKGKVDSKNENPQVASKENTESNIVKGKVKDKTDVDKEKSSGNPLKESKEKEQKGKKKDNKKPSSDKKNKMSNKKQFSIFSDATTDSETVRERMKNMTEEEREEYLANRAKRAEERIQRRKEKYGDKYDEMQESYKKKQENDKLKADKNKKKALEKKLKDDFLSKDDGNEADEESEENTKLDKKKLKNDDESRDKDERIVKRDKKRNKIELDYAEEKSQQPVEDSAGDLFEIGPDGKLVLKPGKTKIDLKNLTKEDLLKLGIDPNLSKAEQLRLLKNMFGDDIDIVYNKLKIGLKNVDDYDSNTNTDDLANDSDVDLDTVNHEQRIKIIMQRGGKQLQDHIKYVIENSKLQEFQSTDEKNSKINFLSTYRLVDSSNLERYAKFFAIEDHDDLNGIINYKGCIIGLGNLKRTNVITNLTEKQTHFIMLALDINKTTEITFRMFAVISALADRMTKLDSYCRDLLEISDLLDIERKLKFYRDLFDMNEQSDRDPNYIKIESVAIDLKAGGLNNDQEKFILSKLHPNEFLEISFLDFLSYIPLFISYHDNIISNPLDYSNSKYSNPNKRRASIQRDMNPLGHNLSRKSQFYKKYNTVRVSINPNVNNATDLNIIGKRKEQMNRYPVLPNIRSLL